MNETIKLIEMKRALEKKKDEIEEKYEVYKKSSDINYQNSKTPSDKLITEIIKLQHEDEEKLEMEEIDIEISVINRKLSHILQYEDVISGKITDDVYGKLSINNNNRIVQLQLDSQAKICSLKIGIEQWKNRQFSELIKAGSYLGVHDDPVKLKAAVDISESVYLPALQDDLEQVRQSMIEHSSSALANYSAMAK